LFHFKCEQLEADCIHEDQDESREALEQRADDHLREHHNYATIDEWVAETFKPSGLTFLRPA
jgi:predicted small metal-binding protein